MLTPDAIVGLLVRPNLRPRPWLSLRPQSGDPFRTNQTDPSRKEARTIGASMHQPGEVGGPLRVFFNGVRRRRALERTATSGSCLGPHSDRRRRPNAIRQATWI